MHKKKEKDINYSKTYFFFHYYCFVLGYKIRQKNVESNSTCKSIASTAHEVREWKIGYPLMQRIDLEAN